MELNDKGLKDSSVWQQAGYELPHFDRKKVGEATKEAPCWIHFGCGNLFRAFPCHAAQKLLNRGIMKTGIIVAEGYDYEILERINRPHDEYSILVTLKTNGTVEKTVIGSVTESCILDAKNEKEFHRLKEIFAKPSLQMASFTITEKGYAVKDAQGTLLPAVEEDLRKGPEMPSSYIGKVAALLYHRYQNGAMPIAMVSMDNCSHNGDRLHEAVKTFAQGWVQQGLADAGFAEYADNRKCVSFPWTMIDKITPRPDRSVEKMLKEDGVSGAQVMVTTKNTYVASFVNAEECEYLVIEDAFPNGRPALEKAGIIFTDRETVDKVEKMKVCTCLNPLHTVLAIFGCLFGYDKISEEMKDDDLKKLVETVGYKEGLPVVVYQPVLNPKEFIDTVLNVRLPNPFMPDTPQRIATDTSQKLSVRFGETIRAYEKASDKKVSDLKHIPFVFAGWLRYLMAVDDEGEEFELSSDPLLSYLHPYAKKFKKLFLRRCADKESGPGTSCEEAISEIKENLMPLLKDADIWGVDLERIGLADTVCGYFAQMLAGKGAVRRALRTHLKETECKDSVN